MSDFHFPVWRTYINAAKLPDVIEYKYVVCDSNNNVVAWET